MLNTIELSAPAIHIKNAFLAFRDTVLFDNLNLDLSAGKMTCLLGPSGIGKSTLLRLIANIITPETARQEKITIRATITCDNSLPLSEHVAYMAQTDLLLPWLSALDNVLLGARLRGTLSSTDSERAKDILQQVGLGNAINQLPNELSGGMKQRVALARTLFENKPVVLMDEPFSALDTITRYKLQTLAADLLKNRTVLFITHDPVEALRLADEIYIMSGQPATLHAPLELKTPTPRDAGETGLIQLQTKLLQELTRLHGEAV